MRIPCNAKLLPKTTDLNLLAQYYSLADAFVICSKKENFPTTCVEAQCCGTPVFGFDTGGTKETVIQQGNYFAEYGDLPTLADIAKRILVEDHSGLSEKAHAVYSSKAMFENYLHEYDCCGHKQRVLLIDVNCKNSSTGKIVYELYNHLRENGRDAAICYGRGPEIKEPDIYKFGIDIETAAHAALARITGYNGGFSPVSTARLIRFIKDYKPDLIHIHELHAYFVNHIQLIEYIRSCNIPLFWTFHCEYAYTGKCGYAYDCNKYQTGCGNCPRLQDYPKTMFFDRTEQMFQRKRDILEEFPFQIITPSQWLANRVKLSFLRNQPIKVIHNGINTDVFHPVDSTELRRKLEIPEDKKIILALAPDILCERKGGHWVLKLAEAMIHENVYFLLVGADLKDGGPST